MPPLAFPCRRAITRLSERNLGKGVIVFLVLFFYCSILFKCSIGLLISSHSHITEIKLKNNLKLTRTRCPIAEFDLARSVKYKCPNYRICRIIT